MGPLFQLFHIDYYPAYHHSHFKAESVQKKQRNLAHENGTAHGKKFREPFHFREPSILLPVWLRL